MDHYDKFITSLPKIKQQLLTENERKTITVILYQLHDLPDIV